MFRLRLSPRRTRCALALAAAVLSGPGLAAEDADLDLKPADFVADEPVAIRVDDLRAGDAGMEILVTVANRTEAPVTARLQCSLFDRDREELGTAEGTSPRVEAGKSVSAEIKTPLEGATRAYCRIEP